MFGLEQRDVVAHDQNSLGVHNLSFSNSKYTYFDVEEREFVLSSNMKECTSMKQ